MLKLDTPIIVGGRSYTHAKLVAGNWRANAETLERLIYQLCTVEDGIIRVGSVTKSDDEPDRITDAPTAFYVPAIADDDPTAAALFDALRGVDALIDAWVVAHDTPTFRDGETTILLAATVEAAPDGELPAREIIDNRTPEE